MKAMQNSSTIPTNIFLLLFFFLFLSTKPSLSDPRITEAGLFCGRGKPPPGTNFITTFVKEMESLSEGINNSQFATHSLNSSSMYGLAQCHDDLSHTDCLLCYAASRTRLPRCLPSVSARIYLDGCFLRYDNYSFFSEAVDAAADAVNCSGEAGEVAAEAAVEAAVAAAEEEGGGGFGVGERGGVYGLAQCWRSLGRRECGECLGKAKREVVKRCWGRKEGRSLNAGCYLRYSTVKFYNHRRRGNGNLNGMSYFNFI